VILIGDVRGPSGSTRAELLATRVEELIESGVVPLGAHLGTKQDLRKSTGLSPASINEAIRLLESRGRIRVRSGPGGGVFAAEPGPMLKLGQSVLAVRGRPEAVNEALMVREALEPLVSVEAARRRTSEDVADLRAILSEMASELGNQTRFIKANWRLHARIADISGNKLLRAIYKNLVEFVADRAEAVVGPPRLEFKQRRFDLHVDLVNAIAAGDLERAKLLAQIHGVNADRDSVVGFGCPG